MLKSKMLYEKIINDLIEAQLPIDQVYFIVKTVLSDIETELQLFNEQLQQKTDQVEETIQQAITGQE